MLKLLTIATLALCLSNVAWTQAQGPKNQAEHNTPKPIQPIPSVVQGEPTPDRKPSGYQWKELVAPANIPNWFLVLVGAWAGWMALGTLNEIRAQTEVNRVSAEAALLNAQAVINAERARILIEFKKVLPPGSNGKAEFHISAVNYGRTPAQIVDMGSPIEVVISTPDDLMVPPSYPVSPPDGERFTAPGASFEVAVFIPRSPMIIALQSRAARDSEGSINDQIAVIYGQVKYRDGISEEIRFSRYCFCFEREPFRIIGGSIVPCGPREYNEHS